MTDAPKPDRKTAAKKVHVAAHSSVDHKGVVDGVAFDDVVVFGTELEALRHIVGKPGWVYVTLTPGASLAETFKAARV